MADEEKEKAEKLAAAKKRFEQLKKEQKKGKKGGKKKEEKSTEVKAEENAEDVADIQETADDGPAAEAETEEVNDAEQPEAARQPSLSQQSKRRSESFRQGADGPQAEVQDLYRKQASKIEQLEKENKALREEKEQEASRLSKAEEELEGLREGSGDMAELKTKAKEADRLSTELASVQRQLSQAQQATAAAAAANPRRVSGPGTDLDAQLASKTTTIETLELEISNLRHQVSTLGTTISENELAHADLTSRAEQAESAQAALRSELDALKVSIAFPSSDPSSSSSPSSAPDPAALNSRIAVLESDLRGARNDLGAAGSRAANLESKIEALTKLHRDATAASTSKDKELSELRAAARKDRHGSHVRDASDFELGEDETETGRLQARIRALEAENFDLRRGVWRERRAELQPGMGGGVGDGDHYDGGGDGGGGGSGGHDYEDVDLDAPSYGGRAPLGRENSYRGGGPSGQQQPRQSSTLSDVINSGINAFTGRERAQSRSHVGAGQHARRQSLGLMSDDGFDEDAFRLAQEEEGKRRIERVKEVKRGLGQWRGWRVDVAESRQQGIGYGREAGPVFEV